MIKLVKIHNFRGISDMAVMLNEKTTIIKGQNGIGKSTILNALSWFFTETLLTDKWGVGENDIESITPDKFERGMQTYVEVELSTGTTYRKYYITEWDENNKVVGHHFEGEINGRKEKNKKTWLQELHSDLKYQPAFRKINEARLFSDPLYALQKIKPEELRNFLIELGAKVENEEVYSLGHQILKTYEDKYKGDFNLMKKDVKANCLQYKKNVETIQNMLASVDDVKEFDSTELERLEQQKEKLIEEKAGLKDVNTELRVKELDLEVERLEQQRQARIRDEHKAIDDVLFDLKLRLSMEEALLIGKRTEATKDLKNKESTLNSEISRLDKTIQTYTNAIDDIKYNLNRTADLGKAAVEGKNRLSIQLSEEMTKVYNNIITCPSCGDSFPANADDYTKWENEHQARLLQIQNDIAQCQKNAKDYADKCKELKDRLEKGKVELEKCCADKSAKVDELLSVQKQIREAQDIAVDTSAYDELDSKIKYYEGKKMIQVDTRDIDSKISNINADKNILISDSNFAINQRFNEIENELLNLVEPINEQYALKSRWANKKQWQNDLQNAVNELNNEESLLNHVNGFLKDYMKLLNDRATNLTGIEFVMQVENLSNDNMKDVCYPLVNGIPFSEVNTSEKYKVGINFIEKVKDIATKQFNVPRNQFPILADRLEGFDFEEKIKALTNESQLVCTRVTTDKEITLD